MTLNIFGERSSLRTVAETICICEIKDGQSWGSIWQLKIAAHSGISLVSSPQFRGIVGLDFSDRLKIV
jgi:hypothetical protein